MPHTPPLLASRFVALDDGMALDLATGGRVWIERRVLDTIARALWPPLMSRLWGLWHPALAQCVDFGFVNVHEWFEAYAVRPPDAADSFSAQARSLPSFLQAHDVVCGLKPLGSGRRSPGLIPTLPSEQTPESAGPVGTGFGMRLVARSLDAHLQTALDDRGFWGPRVWSLDAAAGNAAQRGAGPQSRAARAQADRKARRAEARRQAHRIEARGQTRGAEARGEAGGGEASRQAGRNETGAGGKAGISVSALRPLQR